MTARRHPKFIIIPFLIKVMTVLITLTCRIRWHNREIYQQLLADEKPFVIATWHNCSTIAAWALKNSGITVMVSDSRDGEYVSRLAKHFGIKSMRGSSSRGAKKAIRTGLQLLRNNKPIAITPDGPRGPRYKVQSGVLWFAAAGNAPIIPLHMESSRQWVLKSWDGHVFPKPFSTIHISFGEPVMITRDDLEVDADRAANRLQQAMLGNVSLIEQAIAG
ncbi:MAG: lysophospholipid acyltransferase family protein [Arenicella sp.]|nr:lysophospholipid acyltransferase family protein [Arenicella sp.]